MLLLAVVQVKAKLVAIRIQLVMQYRLERDAAAQALRDIKQTA